jgi:hypothetical protein
MRVNSEEEKQLGNLDRMLLLYPTAPALSALPY